MWWQQADLLEEADISNEKTDGKCISPRKKGEDISSGLLRLPHIKAVLQPGKEKVLGKTCPGNLQRK